jgi:glutathione synthase/RimK-type ligase-like ATP-grasp enzyme
LVTLISGCNQSTNINPKKDSSLAMMLEAMRRKWEVYTLDTTDLFADKEGVCGKFSANNFSLASRKDCALLTTNTPCFSACSKK